MSCSHWALRSNQLPEPLLLGWTSQPIHNSALFFCTKFLWSIPINGQTRTVCAYVWQLQAARLCEERPSNLPPFPEGSTPQSQSAALQAPRWEHSVRAGLLLPTYSEMWKTWTKPGNKGEYEEIIVLCSLFRGITFLWHGSGSHSSEPPCAG